MVAFRWGGCVFGTAVFWQSGNLRIGWNWNRGFLKTWVDARDAGMSIYDGVIEQRLVEAK